MAKCWASSLGDCCNKQSGEHFFTRGLFRDKNISVKGFEWLNGGVSTIPIATLTVNALCKRHNELLSPLDTEAIKIFNVFEEAERLHNVRKSLKQTKIWDLKVYPVNGKLFERWLAKTLVGLFCSVGRESIWHLTGTRCIDPPENVVKAIYAQKDFLPPMGMYFVHSAGETLDFTDGVRVTTLFYPDGGLVGAVVNFTWFQFLIWLDEDVPGIFPNMTGNLFGPNHEQPQYRIESIKYKLDRHLSHKVKFEW